MLHAARYYELFEDAFLQWLATVVPYANLRARGTDLVIVESGCLHHASARLDDELDVVVNPTLESGKALAVRFDVRRGADLLAEGRATYVAVRGARASPLPDELLALAASAPAAGALSRSAATRVIDRLHQAQQSFYAGGRRDELAEVLTEDIVWHIPGSSPIAGTYVGVDQVIEYMTRRRELASRTFRMERRDLLVGDSSIAAITDGSVDTHGGTERWTTIGLYRIDGGRVTEARLVAFDEHDFDRIWSSLEDDDEREGS